MPTKRNLKKHAESIAANVPEKKFLKQIDVRQNWNFYGRTQ
jgi:hypothetical protein